MEKKQNKTKSFKWLMVIICLMVLIITTIIWMIWDVKKVVKYDEVSKVGIFNFSNAKETTTAAQGKIIVKYVDTTGKEIAESKTLEGAVGSEYKLERPEIEGYLTYGNEPYRKTGNYQKEDIEAVFVYQSEDANVEIDEENNTITVKMKNAKVPKDYSIKIITKNEEGELIKGVDYFATKSTGEVIRKGSVEGETFVVGTITVNEEGTDTYTIEENAKPYYEALFGESFDFNIEKTWNEDTNQYDITLDYDKTLEGLEINVVEDEIIINVINKKLVDIPTPDPEPDPEPTPDPKPDPDPVPDPEEPTPEEPTPEPEPEIPEDNRVFDLSIDKYISKVKIENEKGTTEINRGIDKKDNLLKIEVAAKEINNTKLEVTYKFLVQNIGNIPGYVTQITDYMPKDFKNVEKEGWVLKDNTVVYEELADKLLNPGDKEEIELTFIWNLDENNLGSRVNQAEITEYKNDLDMKDITPDNIGKAEMLVTVKTGKEQICILAILTTLTIIAGVIYMEKRRIEKEEV